MIALHGGTIYTVTHGVIDCGTIVADKGKIISIGKSIEIPPACAIVDTHGKFIIPGMVDCHTHLGIAVEGFGQYGNDKNEVDLANGAHLRAIDGINPEDAGLHDAMSGGITSVIITPGSENTIGGLSVAIKTWGNVVDEMILRHPAGLKVAFGENPKQKHVEKKSGFPSTRMGVAALIREQFIQAQYYLYQTHNKEAGSFQRNLALEAVAGVIKGDYPMRAHVHQADDIMTAIRIAEEFNIPLVLEHATDGHKISEQIARRKIPCTIGPSLTARVKMELKDRRYRTPAELYRAGVKFAMITDHPILPVNTLRIEAVMAIHAGLPEEAALRAITIDAAEIMGMSHRIGSLEVGKDADLVVFSGSPFDLYANVERVYIDGVEVHNAL